MQDQRISRLAEILVDYCTKVQEGENVLIQGSPLAIPLIEAVYERVVERGAFPHVLMEPDSLMEIFLKKASKKLLETIPEIQELVIKRTDVLIGISAPENLKTLDSIDSQKLMARCKVMEPLQEHVMKNVRWVGTNYPCAAHAQQAGMSVRQYEDFLFAATNRDWAAISRDMDKIKERFDAGSKVRIVGTETDLAFSIKGRAGEKCAGENNMPDGELFYGPVEDSTTGHIYYEFPAKLMGREVESVRLEFSGGKVVAASAEKQEDFLHEALDTDEGARRLGEFGIGLNPGITRYTGNTLFDEKIGGTVHLALGKAYPGTGENSSAIHWDMVKDLRKNGKIYLDGKLVFENGEFLF